MFGIQTLLATGTGTLLIYALIGIAVFGVAYYFYSRWHHQHRLKQNSEFTPIHDARDQRAAQVRERAVNASLTQENAAQIVTNMQQLQAELITLIPEFNAALKSTETIDTRLVKTDTDLQKSVILPFGALLPKIETRFNEIFNQVSDLSKAYIESIKELDALKKELAQIVRIFDKIQSTAQFIMSQLKAFPNILQSLTDKTQRIHDLEKRIRDREKVIDELTVVTEILLKNIEHQEGVIAELEKITRKIPPSQGRKENTMSLFYVPKKPDSKHSYGNQKQGLS